MAPHRCEAAGKRDRDEVGPFAGETREIRREQRHETRCHDGVIQAVGEAVRLIDTGHQCAVGERFRQLTLRCNQVDDISHHAEQGDHEHRVQTRDHLRAEKRNEDPDAGDPDEQQPALPLLIPAEREQDRVAQLHRPHGKDAHQKENPHQRADRRAFGPEHIRRETTLFGMPSLKVMLPTSNVRTKLRTTMMTMATAPMWQPA